MFNHEDMKGMKFFLTQINADFWLWGGNRCGLLPAGLLSIGRCARNFVSVLPTDSDQFGCAEAISAGKECRDARTQGLKNSRTQGLRNTGILGIIGVQKLG